MIPAPVSYTHLAVPGDGAEDYSVHLRPAVSGLFRRGTLRHGAAVFGRVAFSG